VNRGLVVEGDDSKVAIAKLWNTRPEPKAIPILPFNTNGVSDDGNAPRPPQVRALPKNLRLEIGSELVVGHVGKLPGRWPVTVINSLRQTRIVSAAVLVGHFERVRTMRIP
jgi:hypothetical protein